MHQRPCSTSRVQKDGKEKNGREEDVLSEKKGGGKQREWREQCSGDDAALRSSDLIPL